MPETDEYEKKPLKVKNLKLIDYSNRTYAIFGLDMSTVYRIDNVGAGVLIMCDGKKTIGQISDEIARRTKLELEAVRPIVKNILDEMEKLGFVQFIQ